MSSFAAFISYSHKDMAWAKWIHGALEAYRVPRTPDLAAIPRRLGPCFRDDAESRASADLGKLLLDALAESSSLLVVCSPAAAKSEWVDKEIIEFKRLHGSDRVFSLIVDGTAHGQEDECLAPALKRRIEPFNPHGQGVMEPLAVDVRRLGKRDALLKIVAAILDINFDQLKRRDERRARNRIIAATSMIAAILSIITVFGWTAIESRRAAKQEVVNKLTVEARNALADGRSDVAVQALAELEAVTDGNDQSVERLLRIVTEQFYPVGRLVQSYKRPHYLQVGSLILFLPLKGPAVPAGTTGQMHRMIFAEDNRYALEVHPGGSLTVRRSADGAVSATIADPQRKIEWDGPAYRPLHSGMLLTGITSTLNMNAQERMLAYITADGTKGQLLDLMRTETNGVEDPASWEINTPALLGSRCEWIAQLQRRREDNKYRIGDFKYLAFGPAGLEFTQLPSIEQIIELGDEGEEFGAWGRTSKQPCKVLSQDSREGATGPEPTTEYDFPVRTEETAFWRRLSDDPFFAHSVLRPCTDGRVCIEAKTREPWENFYQPDEPFVGFLRRGTLDASKNVAPDMLFRYPSGGNRISTLEFCKLQPGSVPVCLESVSAINGDFFSPDLHLFRSSAGRWAVYSDAGDFTTSFSVVDLQRMKNIYPKESPYERISVHAMDVTPSDRTLYLVTPQGELWSYALGESDSPLLPQRKLPLGSVPPVRKQADNPARWKGTEGNTIALFAAGESTLVIVRRDGVVASVDAQTGAENWRIRLASLSTLTRAVASPHRKFMVALGQAGSQLIDMEHGNVLSPVMPVNATEEEEADIPLVEVTDEGDIVTSVAQNPQKVTSDSTPPARNFYRRKLPVSEGPLVDILSDRFCTQNLRMGQILQPQSCSWAVPHSP